MKKPKNNKFSLNPIILLRDSMVEFKTYFIKILIISAVVAIPGSLLRVTTFDNGVTDFSVVASIAGLYASLALYFAFFNPQKTKKNSWPKIYVQSSGRFLSYMGVTIVQGIVALFAILGLFLPILSLAGVVSNVFAVAGIVMGLLAAWLLVRISLAAVITATTELGIIISLRASWLATKNRFFIILLDWVIIFTLVILLSGITLSGVYALPVLANNQFVFALINGILVSLILPIVIAYTVQIWNRIRLA